MATADQVAFVLLCVAAPSTTLFPLIYGTTLPWWRTQIGRALIIQSTGLALLVDISLAYRIFGAEYQARDAIRLSVFSVITLGSWLVLIAFLTERGRKRRRGDFREVR